MRLGRVLMTEWRHRTRSKGLEYHCTALCEAQLYVYIESARAL